MNDTDHTPSHDDGPGRDGAGRPAADNVAAGQGVAGQGVAGQGDPNQSGDAPAEHLDPNANMQRRGWVTVGIPLEKSKDVRGSSRRLIEEAADERLAGIVVIVLSVASVALVVVGPKVLGHATNLIFDGLFREGRIDFGALHRTLAFAAALYIGGGVLSWAQGFIMAGVVQRTMQRLRNRVEDKLHVVPLKYLDQRPRGDVLSRVTNDIDNIAQSMQQSLGQLLQGVLTVVGTVAMMMWISWQLALVAIVSVPITMLSLKAITKRSKTRFIAQWKHTGSLNSQVEETFTGHAIVKSFGRDVEAQQRFDATNDELYQASFGAQFLTGAVQPITILIGNLNYVAIAVLGGLKVANGSMGLGDVQAFIQYTRAFSQPLTMIASTVNTLQSGLASAERVFDLLDAPEESQEAAETQDPSAPAVPAEPAEPAEPAAEMAASSAAEPATVGRVEFHDVSFSYDPERPLIEHLHLVAEPGQSVAIVGPTGAGKTTLVNLIMRFYELDRGHISLDGRDIASMSRAELRSQIGMVLQDTWLFGGTIRENIAYGNPAATDEQILAAAKACYVDRFVHSLPDGYDTVLDDEGTSVSAGEKQLLTIARAFIADPAILILDEATSSVDTRTEVLIQRAMAKLRGGRTSFIIAHRLSTIRDADTILVMEHGTIVEQGNHDTLLAQGGAYARLYNAQFAGAATDLS